MSDLKGIEYKRFEDIKHIREDGSEWQQMGRWCENDAKVPEPATIVTVELSEEQLGVKVEYQTINNCGKVTIDNIRRSLST